MWYSTIILILYYTILYHIILSYIILYYIVYHIILYSTISYYYIRLLWRDLHLLPVCYSGSSDCHRMVSSGSCREELHHEHSGFSDSMLVGHEQFNDLGDASSLQNQNNQLALHESQTYETMLNNAKSFSTILLTA